MKEEQSHITFDINRKKYEVLVKPNMTLLDVLRDVLHLTGTKDGSSLGEGGWDTVLLDGKAVGASLILAMSAQGHKIETIEGLAEQNHPVIKAFLEQDHIQGGYDIPGTIMAAKALLDENPNPTVDEVIDALSGVINREGIYAKDIEAVLKAAKMLGKGDPKKIEEELEKASQIAVFIHKPREGESYEYIGKPVITRTNEAYPKATGMAKYTQDVYMPNMVYAKWLRSPYAHAKVKKVDTSKAKALPGVVAVYTWEDSLFKDLPKGGLTGNYPLISNEADFEGDEAGVVVVAESEELCDKALEQLDVEWEELPFVLDPEEALKPDAPLLHPEINPKNNELHAGTWALEDVEKGFKEADKIIEDKVVYKTQHHQNDDIPSTVAWWEGDHVYVWVKAMDPRFRETVIGAALAKVLGTPKSMVHIKIAYVGGAMGGELMVDRSGTRDHVAAAIASKLVNRPVKILNNRRYYFVYRYPNEIAYYKVGVKKDGTITAVSMKSVIDAGGEGGGTFFWQSDIWNMPMRYLEIYTKIPNLFHEQHIVWTSNQPSWWMRCEQNGTAWITVAIFDRVANELNLDPTEVALKNACESGLPSLTKCIEEGKKLIDWDNKKHKPGEKALSNEKKHGIGFCWAWEWDSGAFASGAIRVTEDGSVHLIAGGPDIGVSAHTTYIYTVAEALGVSPDKISYTPTTSGTTEQGFLLADFGGSWTCGANVDMFWEVAQKAKRTILDKASPKMLVSPEMLDIKNGIIHTKTGPSKTMTIAEAIAPYDILVSVSSRPTVGADNCPLGAYVCAYGFGQKRKYTCFQAHFVEVEADPETGLVDIKKIVNVHDVGTVISPSSVHGQIYGGAVLAVGRALQEESVNDPKTGVLLTTNLIDYRVPTMADTPTTVDVALEVGKGPGAFGVVGVGEDTCTMDPGAIANAVYNALGVAPDGYERPFTPSKLLKTL